MQKKLVRALSALVLALAAGLTGYSAGSNTLSTAQTVAAPPPGSVRVVYSLDAKQNDKEIIALIDSAERSIIFAMYEFTLQDVADALIRAKERGVRVRGLVDSGESSNSYDKPIIESLVAAGIPIETEKHASGNGIMHIKAIVTDKAYALGSYNWTSSATTVNDELLEIGTDPSLRQTYEDILERLLTAYAGSAVAGAAAPRSAGTIPYTEAPNHIGEKASVTGVLVDAYTSKSGTVFLDFCASYKTCPFTAVIFASDVKKFGDLSRYKGAPVTVTGTISSYQNKAEIILSSPSQLSRE